MQGVAFQPQVIDLLNMLVLCQVISYGHRAAAALVDAHAKSPDVVQRQDGVHRGDIRAVVAVGQGLEIHADNPPSGHHCRCS